MLNDDDKQIHNLPEKKKPTELNADILLDSAVPVMITEEDADELNLHHAGKKVFLQEMKACDIYLHNLHKGFKSATTIRGIVALVETSLKVHAHRREVLKDVEPKREAGGPVYEFDDMGNLIPPKLKKVS